MALANVACLLAKAETRPKVLVIDWDLEAPGLHRYFATKSEKLKDTKQVGLIDYFWSLREILDSNHSIRGKATPWHERDLDNILPIDRFLIRDVVTGVDMITAGKFDSEYPRLVNSFNWVEFHERHGFAISTLRDSISQKYDYCLIDSRTGVTDTSGICTTLLPEKLVGVFTPNKQSLYGLVDLLERAVEYRRASNDFRSLSIFPLPSRIDTAERILRQTWREEYQACFETLFKKSYGLAKCDLDSYFDEIQLPYMSYYAYGENIAVLEERSDSLSLSRAYEAFYNRLIQNDSAWNPQTAVPGRPLRVFIAHSTADRTKVGDLYHRLQADGFSPWLDEQNLVPGQHWRHGIKRAIRSSDVVLVLLSQASASREGYVQREIKFVLDVAGEMPPDKIFIIPARLDPVELPATLSKWQWVNLFEAEGYDRLVKALRIRAGQIGAEVVPA